MTRIIIQRLYGIEKSFSIEIILVLNNINLLTSIWHIIEEYWFKKAKYMQEISSK